MRASEVMKSLEKEGTAQNRKVYARHGVTGAQYGVSFKALRGLAKKLGRDQSLANKLWDSGNHDARILGAMVADPAAIRLSTLNAWSKTLDNYPMADALAELVAKSPHARSRAELWSKSKSEFVAQTGWDLIAHLATSDPELDDAFFEGQIRRIEDGISGAKNRARHAMNGALIAIGLRTPNLRRKATAAAKRIGKVEVDHGATSCQTPEAVQYIDKTWKAGRAQRAFRGKK